MMKKEKLVLALLCLGSVAIAQSSVTLGTFGFAKDSAVNSGFHIASMQFFAGVSNSPVTLYGDSLPVGSTIYAFDKDLQEYAPSATYEAGYDASFNLVTNWSNNPELPHGGAYWVKVPSDMNATLSGDVPMDDSIQTTINAGFQLLSFPYPVDRVVTNLGINPAVNDVVYVFDKDLQEYAPSATYEAGYDASFNLVTNWSKPELLIEAGEGFWYKATVANIWTATRPYSEN